MPKAENGKNVYYKIKKGSESRKIALINGGARGRVEGEVHGVNVAELWRVQHGRLKGDAVAPFELNYDISQIQTIPKASLNSIFTHVHSYLPAAPRKRTCPSQTRKGTSFRDSDCKAPN